MILAAEWAKRRRRAPPVAFTVDHGLRNESAGEAARVAAWAKTAGVPHRILAWEGRKPAKNVQAAARTARYRLLGDAMRQAGVTVLLTGHTEDDQAETFLLRLARGSGLDGLSGMAPIAPFPLPEFDDVQVARPLLGFLHDRLVATLDARKQPWIADPSNDAERFARVQIRALAPALEKAGITRDRIARAAAHLARAREAIDAAVAELFDQATECSSWGYALLAPDRFAAAPAEVALRALSRLVEGIGGGEYPPRFEQTQAALAWLVAPDDRLKGRTFAGCRLSRRADGRVLAAREEAALSRARVTLKPGKAVLWDRRFRVALTAAPAALDIRAVGPRGLKAAGKGAALPPVEPHRIAATTPGLWRDGRLVAAPLLGFAAAGVAVSADFVGLKPGAARVKRTLRKHL